MSIKQSIAYAANFEAEAALMLASRRFPEEGQVHLDRVERLRANDI